MADPDADNYDDGLCDVRLYLGTKYQYDDLVPTYQGIMFHVKAKRAMTLQTFEVNLWFQDNMDMSVQVYTYAGAGYQLLYNKASAWTKIADTAFVRNPSGQDSAIIPVTDFQEIAFEAEDLRSFYIAMNGPWIKHMVDALSKQGDVFLDQNDFTFYTGLGFNAPTFSDQYDTILHPQFAGVMHYKVQEECAAVTQETTVQYQFVVDSVVSSAILSKATMAVENVLKDKLATDATLADFQSLHALTPASITESTEFDYTAPCSPRLDMCAGVATNVTFTHQISLTSGALQYQLYQYTNEITTALADSFAGQVGYVGYIGVASSYVMTLQGVPASGEPMDIVQQTYFGQAVAQWFNRVLPPINAWTQVFQVTIDAQDAQRRFLRDLQANGGGAITVTGSVKGAQLAYLEDDAFATNLATALDGDDGSSSLAFDLQYGVLVPSDIADENKADFFRGITGSHGTFESIIQSPAPAFAPLANNTRPDKPINDAPDDDDTVGNSDNDDSLNKTTDETKNAGQKAISAMSELDTMTWVSIAAAIFVCILFCCICRHCTRKAKHANGKKGTSSGRNSRDDESYIIEEEVIVEEYVNEPATKSASFPQDRASSPTPPPPSPPRRAPPRRNDTKSSDDLYGRSKQQPQSRAPPNRFQSKSFSEGMPLPPRDVRLQAEIDRCRRMRPSELKRELSSLNVSTHSMCEKHELVEALAEARVGPPDVMPPPPPPPRAPQRSYSPPPPPRKTQRSYEEVMAIEKRQCQSMKASELKRELESRGISTRLMFEKCELVHALAEARLGRPQNAASSAPPPRRAPPSRSQSFDPSHHQRHHAGLPTPPPPPPVGPQRASTSAYGQPPSRRAPPRPSKSFHDYSRPATNNDALNGQHSTHSNSGRRAGRRPAYQGPPHGGADGGHEV